MPCMMSHLFCDTLYNQIFLLQWRGQVLYEMHKPMMVKANKGYQTGDITKDEFLKTLKKISIQLEESVKCLEVEADGTKEAYQAKMATKALSGVKELIFFSDFL